MSKVLAWFHRIGGPLGTLATLVVTPWGTVLTLVLGAVGAIWAAGTEWVLQPRVEIAAAIFVLLLWTYIGIVTLISRWRGVPVSPVPKMDWGLAFLLPYFHYDPRHEAYSLQVGIQLQNVSGIALRCRIEKLEIKIITRTITNTQKKEDSIIVPFATSKTYWADAYPRSEIEAFMDKEVAAIVEAIIAYGPHDKPPVRRLTVRLEGPITLKEPLTQALRTILEHEENIA